MENSHLLKETTVKINSTGIDHYELFDSLFLDQKTIEKYYIMYLVKGRCTYNVHVITANT